MSARAGFAFLILAATSGTALAQDFPEGTFASDKEACDKLAEKTPAELGDELDFQVISKKGLVAFQQSCDFVTISPHDASSWVATAFCDEAGYSYPDLFSIKKKGDDRLNVTRVTDLTQSSSAADAGATDEPEGDDGTAKHDEESGGTDEGEAGEGPQARTEEPSGESYSAFVKCPSVKP
jgi:hypothetical protein